MAQLFFRHTLFEFVMQTEKTKPDRPLTFTFQCRFSPTTTNAPNTTCWIQVHTVVRNPGSGSGLTLLGPAAILYTVSWDQPSCRTSRPSLKGQGVVRTRQHNGESASTDHSFLAALTSSRSHPQINTRSHHSPGNSDRQCQNIAFLREYLPFYLRLIWIVKEYVFILRMGWLQVNPTHFF